MRKVGLLLLPLTLLSGLINAQQATPAPRPVYGAVSGRITCTDTNLPARLASVTLQTINVKPEATTAPKAMPSPEKMLRTYQTALDGSFVISKVVPGTYYVVIQTPGYLSPITQFTRAELEQPTAEILARIVKAVPTITVESNHTANIETRIERGAELTGTIRYDDGSPVAGTYVTVLSKEARGGKTTWVSNESGGRTDDLGHYRITGLSAGEFLLEMNLMLMDTYVSNVLGGSRSSMNTMKYGLSFYSGDVVRKDNGKSIKLNAGEQRDGADLTIPVSKLHRVVGTLAEQRSGHIVNAGDVALKFTDGTELVNAHVDPDDGTFHFDFVPEGDYTLLVTNARDVIREPEPFLPNATPMPGAMKETLVRAYGDTSQPLTVRSEVTGLTVPVPPSKARAAAQ